MTQDRVKDLSRGEFLRASAVGATGQDQPVPESVRKVLAQAENTQERAQAEITKATYLVNGLH